jgi:hypothetical protein
MHLFAIGPIGPYGNNGNNNDDYDYTFPSPGLGVHLYHIVINSFRLWMCSLALPNKALKR